MTTWKDGISRRWEIDLNDGTLARVKVQTGIDLRADPRQQAKRLSRGNGELLVRVL